MLLTKASDTGLSGPCPAGPEHGTGGVYGHGYDESQGDDGARGSFCFEDEPHASGPSTGAVSAARGQPGRRGGPTPCWNEQCERMYDASRRYSLCNWCGIFEFGAKPCNLCKVVSKPHALRCDNWGRGCPGKVPDFGPELTDNATPGSPAFVLGQQVAALSRESKKLQASRVRAERAAKADQGGQARSRPGPDSARRPVPGHGTASQRRRRRAGGSCPTKFANGRRAANALGRRAAPRVAAP